MDQQIDVSTITDMTLLKSLAYDQIAMREEAQRALNLINDRITTLAQGTLAAQAAVPKSATEADQGLAPTTTGNEEQTSEKAQEAEVVD